MCGIAGILNLNGKPIDLKILANMTGIIKHRGPDDTGIMLFDPKLSEGQTGIIEYTDKIMKLEGTEDNHSNYNVGLAHARLVLLTYLSKAISLCAPETILCGLCTMARYTTT